MSKSLYVGAELRQQRRALGAHVDGRPDKAEDRQQTVEACGVEMAV